MVALNVELVMQNGKVDEEASLNVFQAQLDEFVAQHAVETDTIATAVAALFDKYLGKAIAMPTLSSLVCHRLNASPENHGALSEQTLNYVRANSKGDDSLFVIVKGQHGGVARRADCPARPTV